MKLKENTANLNNIKSFLEKQCKKQEEIVNEQNL